MAQRKRGERVLGPYAVKGYWRVVLVGHDGSRTCKDFASRQEANRLIQSVEKQLAVVAVKSVEDARDEYKQFLLTVKQNKERSVEATMYRLCSFFQDNLKLPLSTLTPALCAGLYEALRTRPIKTGKPFSVDSHRNFLAEVRTFLKWCVEQKWLTKNPLEGTAGVGRRKHGKDQLRIDEAVKWEEKAWEYVEAGEVGAIAALMTVTMAMRAGEIIRVKVRDLDAEGTVLWVPEAKTEAGKRRLQVPKSLQMALKRTAEGKDGEALIFGHHWRDWPCRWVRRICKASRVPKVSAHGMRGLHSTLSTEAGRTLDSIARTMGHESSTTTKQSYIRREAVDQATQRRVLRALKGGGESDSDKPTSRLAEAT